MTAVTAAEPAARSRGGLRRVLVTLCITETTSWGILYYAFPVLAGRISADTGWSLTRLMHRFPDDGPFERAMQVAELDYIASSRAAQMSIAENYVGLPV